MTKRPAGELTDDDLHGVLHVGTKQEVPQPVSEDDVSERRKAFDSARQKLEAVKEPFDENWAAAHKDASEKLHKLIRAGLISSTGGTGAAILSGQLDLVPGLLDLAFAVFLIGLIGLIVDYFQYLANFLYTRTLFFGGFEDYHWTRRLVPWANFFRQLALALCILGIAIGIGLVWSEKRRAVKEGVTEQVSLVELTFQCCIV